jgi:hypothetical protein
MTIKSNLYCSPCRYTMKHHRGPMVTTQQPTRIDTLRCWPCLNIKAASGIESSQFHSSLMIRTSNKHKDHAPPGKPPPPAVWTTHINATTRANLFRRTRGSNRTTLASPPSPNGPPFPVVPQSTPKPHPTSDNRTHLSREQGPFIGPSRHRYICPRQFPTFDSDWHYRSPCRSFTPRHGWLISPSGPI